MLNPSDATISLLDQDTRWDMRRHPVGTETDHRMMTSDGMSLIVGNATTSDLPFIVQRMIGRYCDDE